MQYTGKQIKEKGIISNIKNAKSIQQQGVDLTIKSLRKLQVPTYVDGTILEKIVSCGHGGGVIPKDGKTTLPFYETCSLTEVNKTNYWVILPGEYYEVTFNESCSIPSNSTLHILPRSSMVRCGADLRSGQFDGGFKADNMGCFLRSNGLILIEENARIAQAIVCESYEVADKDLYNGQYQKS